MIFIPKHLRSQGKYKTWQDIEDSYLISDEMAKYFNIHAPRLRNHERVAVQGFLSSFKRFETIRYLNFVLHGKKRKDDNFLA
jgi:hypothetical protein